MENNKRWVIGIDLDGTLLRGENFEGENYKVSPLTRKVLHAMYEKGHVVCIDTGRGFHGSKDVYDSIGLPNPVINFAGAHIHNPLDNEFKEDITPLNKEALLDIINNDEYANRIKGISFDTPSISYFETEELKELKQMLVDRGSRIYSDKAMSDEDIIIATNIIYDTDEEEIWTIIDHLSEKYKEQLNIVDWISRSVESIQAFGIEINAVDSAKGDAVLKVAKQLGIPESNTMGIGDSPNDRDLMTKPTIGVAVANARDEIKELADIVIEETHEEEGVAKFLIRHFDLDIEY